VDFDITYVLYYQKPGDPSWYMVTNLDFKHGTQHNPHEETTDLDEAQTFATLIKDGKNYPTYLNRPRLGHVHVVQVFQRIIGGGPLITYGSPHPDTGKNDAEPHPAVSTT
jgi:hypothetical protein